MNGSSTTMSERSSTSHSADHHGHSGSSSSAGNHHHHTSRHASRSPSRSDDGISPKKQRRISDTNNGSSGGDHRSGAGSSSSSSWRPAKPFIVAPVGELRQLGDVKFGPGAKSALLGILGGVLPKLSSEQQDTVIRAKKYAMEQSIKMVLMKQTLAHQQQLASQRTQVQRQQALALMCRVYVGSISFELKEDTIRAAFLPFGPIKSINMSWDPITQKHKGFAFVEYEIPEGAQLALEQMNGAMMGGRNIKVGRPSNMPQAQQVIDEIQEEAKNYNRIFIASIHPDLSEEDIKSVFEAFGPIQFCRLAAGASLHSHKGYGFIEYATKQAMDEAISSMNLFDLGGQLLRVGRSITPPNALMGPVLNSAMPTAAAVAAAAATAKIQAMEVVASHGNGGPLENLMRAVVSRSNIDQESLAAVVAAAAAAAGGSGVTGATGSVAAVAAAAAAAAALKQHQLQHQHAAAVAAASAPMSALSMAGSVAQSQNAGNATQSPKGFGSPVDGPAQLSPLQPPQVVTPVLGSAGHIHVSGGDHGKTALLPNPPGLVPSLPGGSVAHADTVSQHLRSKQEELQKKLLDEGEPQTLQQQETMSIKGQNARHLVMQRLMRPNESKVVILRNMVGPEDVDEMLKEEIHDECSKFGVVERVIIYNEKQTDNEDDTDAEILVKIFVEFSMELESTRARDALNGRYFGGRMVRAELYDQALYEHGDMSG